MEQVLKNLECFAKNKRKTHLLCGCDEDIIHAISQLIYNFLKGKLKIKREKSVRKQLYPIRLEIRKLADKRICTRTKRKILVDKNIREILHPIIKNNLLPALLKSME